MTLSNLQEKIAQLYVLYAQASNVQKELRDKYPAAAESFGINEHYKMFHFMGERISTNWNISGWPKHGPLGTGHEQDTEY